MMKIGTILRKIRKVKGFYEIISLMEWLFPKF